MDPMEKNNSDTCHHDEVTGRKRKGMDVDNSGHEQYNTSCNQKTGKIGPKNYTTVKDAKKRSKKNTKTGSPLGNGGDDYAELEEKQYRQSSCSKVDNRGGEVNSTAAVTTKRKSAVGSLPAASHGNTIFNQVISHKKKGATVSVEEVMRHDQRHDDDTKNTATSSQPVQSDTDDENENDEYVYRVLRIGEPYEEGIYPKDLNSKVRLEEHVLRGGLRGRSSTKSRFVSCCKTIDGVYEMAFYTDQENYTRDVVKINISKLPKEVTVIDLTDNYTRNQRLHDCTALRYAEMYEEVILEPKICIPSECLEKIGEIRRKKFFLTN